MESARTLGHASSANYKSGHLAAVTCNVTILDTPPLLFPLTSHAVASPEPSPSPSRDTSTSHVPLGSHVIHPRAPTVPRQMPRPLVSCPQWLRPLDSPPAPPSSPVPEPGSDDLWIDSTVMEEPSLLKHMVTCLPRRWAPNPNDLMDID